MFVWDRASIILPQKSPQLSDIVAEKESPCREVLRASQKWVVMDSGKASMEEGIHHIA